MSEEIKKVKGIDPNTIIEGVKFSGAYVGALQTLGMYLQAPDELMILYKETKEDYDYLIEPIYILLSDINKIIEDKNLYKEVEIPNKED